MTITSLHRIALAATTLAFANACGGKAADTDAPFPYTQPGKADSLSAADLPVQMDPPLAGTFTQEIDHPLTAAASLGTFAQRYWYSTEYAHGPSSPVLFYFCGEAACDPWYVQSMADEAKALNASVVALEHRYYGTSVPFSDKSLEHMKYLTIHNALEDGAAFEAYAKANLPLKGKWIAVGGSYPGMLAAFYREQHPELVVGAWASSAPVNVQLSFYGYDQIASEALGPTCTLLFQQVLAAAGTAYDNPAARDQLSTQLWGGPLDPTQTSKADFLSAISSVAESDAQYGMTRGLCAALQQEQSTPLQGYLDYLNPPLFGDANDDGGVADGGAPADMSVIASAQPFVKPSAFIPKVKAPAAISDFTGSEWFYQVCTEVGFYQVHNPTGNESILSSLITESYMNNLCTQWVGLTPNIAATRASYLEPLLDGKASNILFVNGSLDPWSSLSFTDQASAPAGVTTLVVQTGSHCEDLDNLQPTSVLGVYDAHKQFYNLAKAWLK